MELRMLSLNALTHLELHLLNLTPVLHLSSKRGGSLVVLAREARRVNAYFEFQKQGKLKT